MTDSMEDILIRFDRHWHSEGTADIKLFVEEASQQERIELLTELVKIDLEYRWKAGDHRLVEEYLIQFPEINEQDGLLTELVKEEILCRQRFASNPNSSEFEKRFPEHSSQFRSLIERGNQSPKKRTVRKSLSTLINEQVATDSTAIGETPNQESATTQIIASRFELKDKLGQGAFASVYRAWDRSLQRPVAVKIARRAFAGDASFTARFLREAQSAARLEHPGIVSVYEVGDENERVYMVQELIQGGTLADLIEESPVSYDRAARLIVEICHSLDYAHQCGIVHRDIKPANIMIDREGHPRIADFGLAMQSDAANQLTHEGDLLGTPAYMSPEQARSDHPNVGNTSDVYSVGVILYQMLSGQLPFDGDPATVIAAVVNNEPVAPRKIRSSVPVDLQTICMKAMDKLPSGRYLSAREMADDLTRYLKNEPIHARRISTAEHLWKWCKRRPGQAATIAGFTLLLTALAIASYISIANERDRFREQRDVANTERDRANQMLFDSMTGNAENLIRNRDSEWYDKALKTIEEASQIEFPGRKTTRLRDLGIELLTDRSNRLNQTQEWAAMRSGIAPMAIEIDSEQQFAVVGYNHGVARIINVEQPEFDLRLTGPDIERIYHPVFDLKHRWVLGWADDEIWHWPLPESWRDLPAGTSIKGTKLEIDPCYTFELSNDQTKIALGYSNGDILVYEFDAGDPTKPLSNLLSELLRHEEWVTKIDFSADDRLIVSASTAGSVFIWDLRDESIVDQHIHPDPVNWVEFSPTGREVVFVDHSSFTFHYWHIGKTPRKSPSFANAVWQVRYLSPNQVVATCIDGSLTLVESGRKTTEIKGLSEVYSVAVISDKKIVIAGFRNGYLRRFDLNTNHIARGFSCSHQFSAGNHQLFTERHVYDLNADQQTWSAAFDQRQIDSIVELTTRNLVICGTVDGQILWHDLESNQTEITKKAHDSRIQSLACNKDQSIVISVDSDGIIKFWDSGNRTLIETIDADVGTFHCMSASVGSPVLVVGGIHGYNLIDFSGLVKSDSNSHKKPTVKPLVEEFQLNSTVLFTEDFLALSRGAGTIELRSLDGSKVSKTLNGHNDRVISMAFDRDKDLLISSSVDGELISWDIETGKRKLRKSTLNGISTLTIDPRGKFVAGFDNARFQVQIFDLETLEFREETVQLGLRPALVFSQDGQQLWLGAFGLWQIKRNVIVRTADRSEQMGQAMLVRPTQMKCLIEGSHTQQIWGVTHSSDEKWVATTDHNGFVKAWDSTSGELLATMEGHDPVVWSAQFTPDSQLLITGGAVGRSGEIIAWTTESWKEAWRLRVAERLISCLATNSEGDLLLAGSFDGSVHLIEAKTGEVLEQIYDSRTQICSLKFSPDGKQLLMAGGGDGVKIFELDLADGLIRLKPDPIVLHDEGERYWSGCFSRDGRYIATASESGIVSVYSTRPNPGGSFLKICSINSGLKTLRQIEFSGNQRYLACSAYAQRGIVWDLKALQEQLSKINLSFEETFFP